VTKTTAENRVHVELDGEQVFLWRWRNFCTQEQMAERAGIAPTTLRRAENGQGAVTSRTARKIAHVMGVEPKAIERA
jgi:DNA-binding XRE family transcriptional regulator